MWVEVWITLIWSTKTWWILQLCFSIQSTGIIGWWTHIIGQTQLLMVRRKCILHNTVQQRGLLSVFHITKRHVCSLFSCVCACKLTCAVWSRARPRAICQTLTCGRASEEIALHTRIHNGVGEGCTIHTGNAAMSRRTWIPTLYRWKMAE